MNFSLRVGLDRDGDKRVSEYSKGMKARLNFIKALMHDPALLCLDEPTSGLDPANSRVMKDLIRRGEKNRGRRFCSPPIICRTQQRLCDGVAFIVNGKIMALDSPHNLIMSGELQGSLIPGLIRGEQQADCPLDALSQDKRLQTLIMENRLQSVHSSEPTLNDIFIDITGGHWYETQEPDVVGYAFSKLKYGFYFLYTVLTVLYAVVLLAMPESWQEKVAPILIFL